jgi:hypothetical protein
VGFESSRETQSQVTPHCNESYLQEFEEYLTVNIGDKIIYSYF